ncbi:MAG: M4 family metallopeptidase [Bacteroidota bacterium]|jgi:Zn-dependent metalloprotease
MKSKKQINFKHLAVLLLTLLIFNIASAQTIPKLQDPTNQFIINKAIDIDANGGIIYYKKDSLLVGQLFTTYFISTGLGPFDSMALVNTTFDSILADEDSPAPNLAHNTYQQFYKGLEVHGSIYKEHSNGNCVLITSGFLIENLNINPTPEINEQNALALVKNHVNTDSTLWDSTFLNPTGKLVICYDDQISHSYKLAWIFRIITLCPFSDKLVYINASSGLVFKQVSNYYLGDFRHIYYSDKDDLDTRKKGGNLFISDKWYLHANDNSRNILTQDDDNDGLFYNTHYNSPIYYKEAWDWDDMTYSDGDDHWGNDHWSATAGHYNVQKTWDFFKNKYNRNGMTGWGKHVKLITNFLLTGYINNNYDKDDYIFISNNSIGNREVTYDIVAHEFTHGIINNSQPLPNEKVSGSINESFADIFGFMFERYMLGYVGNWTLGEDAGVIGRDMQNPNNVNQPSYFQQKDFWENTTNCIPDPKLNNNCHVHKNNGVMNKWFYLLSSGGSQPIYINNILQPTRYVSGIGIDKAARIAYYTMITFENYNKDDNNNFETVRANTIAAARELYGYCSNEYVQTCKAWYAVNVGFDCNGCVNEPIWCRINNEQNFNTKIIENENKLVKVNLFPNPAKNIFTLNVEEINNIKNDNLYEINILNMEGKILYSKNYSTIVNTSIEIEALNAGIYF